jgi:hypothetical protein
MLEVDPAAAALIMDLSKPPTFICQLYLPLLPNLSPLNLTYLKASSYSFRYTLQPNLLLWDTKQLYAKLHVNAPVGLYSGGKLHGFNCPSDILRARCSTTNWKFTTII